MACKTTRRTSATPEEAAMRSVRARRRFKALVHKVILNLSWLDDDDDEKLGENVAKNIHLLTRKKKGKKSSITLHDKSILNKPEMFRTEEEKNNLAEVLGKLMCFNKFSKNVCNRLAGVTYFSFYEAGRTIFRQGHEPHNVYFILSGNVTISMTRIDSIFNETVTINAGILGTGCMFGEVALLLTVTRSMTVITLTPCEFLYVQKEDFNTVLRAPVKRHWDKIMNALGRFSYFKQWDEFSLRECCIMSKLKSFQRDETILGDGQGLKKSVYFILKGKCKVIEHLLVSVTRESGKKHFKLYNAYVPKKVQCEQYDKQDFNRTVDLTLAETIRRNTLNTSNKSKAVKIKNDSLAKVQSAIMLSKVHEQDDVEDYNLPFNVETHFMQVCILSELACFGVGENMTRRRIVAITDVKCLLIPRYWILQKNKGNLWTRIQQYLNSHIPNTNKIFHEFLEQRKWREYKNQLVDSIVRRSASNVINNVPYSIRIHEDYDFVE